jgi:hypothetical protein
MATRQINKNTYPTYREADRKSIDSSFVHTLITLSKGMLACIRHVSRTSRRCANQRHATSDRSVSLSYYPILATKKYLE